MNKLFLLLTAILFTLGCKEDRSEPSPSPTDSEGQSYRFYTGTYTRGSSTGIYAYEIDAEGGLKSLGQMAETPNPSFLARVNDSTILSVNELAVADSLSQEPTASVSLFRESGDGLRLLVQRPTGGAFPCHLAVHPDGWVVASNYGGGSLTLFRLGGNDSLSMPLDTLVFEGRGRNRRQEAPHAHSAHFVGESLDLLALDLGSDAIWKTAVDPTDSTLVRPYAFKVRPGSGPRHATLHPNGRWFYVLQELSNQVSLIQLRQLMDTTRTIDPTYTSTLPNDYRGENTGAELKISGDGRFLYSSNRGHNSITAFRISPTRGTLEPLFWQSSGGQRPRNFNLTPDGRYLIAANEDSDRLVSFRRDGPEGTLESVDSLQAPVPVYILFD